VVLAWGKEVGDLERLSVAGLLIVSDEGMLGYVMLEDLHTLEKLGWERIHRPGDGLALGVDLVVGSPLR
jgi:hypothetical protein